MEIPPPPQSVNKGLSPLLNEGSLGSQDGQVFGSPCCTFHQQPCLNVVQAGSALV